MIVMKFGGTSNQDAAAMQNVSRIVAAHRAQKPVIVISAIAKGTNMLEQAGRLASEGRLEESHATLKKLFARHYAILEENVTDPGVTEVVRNFLDDSLRALEELTRGVAILRELTPRTLDAFYVFGELMSSRLVWGTMRAVGLDAVWLDTKDFMITNGAFNAAVPFMDIVRTKLSALVNPGIDRGTVYVTQGFIGVTERGERTTMGREASDYSAAVIGAALDASDVQIWTDVDGILTGDPTIIAAPKKVRMMSFQEAYDVSFFGAKVLHSATMLPAIEKNIPIHIFNSRRPHLSGSLVAAATVGSRPVIKSVTYLKNIAVLRILPRHRMGQYMFWENVFNVLNRNGASARLTATSEYGLSIALDEKYNLSAIARDLADLGTVESEAGQAIVAIVGSRIAEVGSLLGSVFRSTAGAPIGMISFGASNASLSFVVPDGKVIDLVQNLHTEFFGTVNDPETFEDLG